MSDDSPTEIEKIKQKLSAAEKRADRLTAICRSQQDRLLAADGAARENKDLRNKLETISQKLAESRGQAPNEFGTFVKQFDETSAYVYVDRKLLRLQLWPDLNFRSVKQGQLVRLNKDRFIVGFDELDLTGVICKLQEVIEPSESTGLKRLMVSDGINDSLVVYGASDLESGQLTLKPGCSLLVNKTANFAFEIIEDELESELDLELVPDISYDDIGGLDQQIQQVHDEIELPLIHSDLYQKYDVTMPKGILLYGPPGCGKTLIAKAIASSIASRVKAKTGSSSGKAFFINIKGPELLDKYVGETERQIRQLFQKARQQAATGTPVVVFFDEMESLFSVRGSGVSSDVEKTIVPQLLSEIDGVESMENVLVIGASNREDMIDPAVLRPGRIDVKIKVDRPGVQQARDIFMKYISRDLPVSASQLQESGDSRELAISTMVGTAVTAMFREDPATFVAEIAAKSGDAISVYYKDFISGAMIKNIVDRAKKLAIKSEIETGTAGVSTSHFVAAVNQEFAENKYISTSISSADWSRINGRIVESINQKSDDIPTVETSGDLVNDDSGRDGTYQTGMYL